MKNPFYVYALKIQEVNLPKPFISVRELAIGCTNIRRRNQTAKKDL